MQHKNITGEDIHVSHAWTYADAAAREAATGFAATDVGKIAHQQDNDTFWFLANHSPITWTQSGGAGMTADLSDLAPAPLGVTSAGVATGASRGDHVHPMPSAAEVGAAPTGHNHDDRYYTDAEVDTLLAGKSDTGHGHATSDVTGLDTALAAKAPLVSPDLTGTPTAPTAAPGTNTTQLATTAFVTAAVAAGGGGGGGGSSSPTASVRQTVLSGGVDGSGFANFLSAGSGLAVNVAATSVPVVIGFAAGFDATTGAPVDYFGRITADTSITGLTASSTCYLYADYAAGTVTLGHSVLAPVYQACPSGSSSIVPPMTSPTTPSPYVIDASSAFSGTYYPDKAFDGSTATTWATSSGSFPQYINMDFGSVKSVGSYSIQAANSGVTSLNALPKDWTLQGSNDNASWTVVDTQTNQTGWSFQEKRTFTLASVVSYRYLKIVITANNGNTGETDVGEIQYYTAAGTDQHWFDLSTMTMKRWTGAAWETKNRVFLGEAVTNASAVTSVTTYALRGRYDSGRFSVTASTNYTKNHNLGVVPGQALLMGAVSAGGTLSQFFNHHNSATGWEGANYRLDRLTALIQTHTYTFVSEGASASFRNSAVEASLIVTRGW